MAYNWSSFSTLFKNSGEIDAIFYNEAVTALNAAYATASNTTVNGEYFATHYPAGDYTYQSSYLHYDDSGYDYSYDGDFNFSYDGEDNYYDDNSDNSSDDYED